MLLSLEQVSGASRVPMPNTMNVALYASAGNDVHNDGCKPNGVSNTLRLPSTTSSSSHRSSFMIPQMGTLPLELWLHIFQYLEPWWRLDGDDDSEWRLSAESGSNPPFHRHLQHPSSSLARSSSTTISTPSTSITTWQYYCHWHFILISRSLLDCRDVRVNRFWYGVLKEAFGDLFVASRLGGGSSSFQRSGRRMLRGSTISFLPFSPCFHWYSLCYDYVVYFCEFRHRMQQVVQLASLEEKHSFHPALQKMEIYSQLGRSGLQISDLATRRIGWWHSMIDTLDRSIQIYFSDDSLKIPMDLLFFWSVHAGQVLFSFSYQNYVFTSRLFEPWALNEPLRNGIFNDMLPKQLVPGRHLLPFANDPMTDTTLLIDVVHGYIYSQSHYTIRMVAYDLMDFFDTLLDKRSKWSVASMANSFEAKRNQDLIQRRHATNQQYKRRLFDTLLCRQH